MTSVRLSALCCAIIAVFAAGNFVARGQEAPARSTLAFPEAEGFGAHALGGRGGKVYAVTTLEDFNPKSSAKSNAPILGSLRHAVMQPGPRTVVFRVSGTIELKAPLIITEPFLTVAGQTAPGEGICLKNFGTSVRANDVILRYLRFRPGDEAGKPVDALDVYMAKNVIIDHCTASWSVDEALSVTGEGCENVTVQWCIISEALNMSVHDKGEHGYGSLIRVDGGVTFHHNLYAHHRTRCPRPGTYGKEPGILLDFRNNVIYDWISPAGYTSADPARINYVANYAKPGPSTRERAYMFNIGGAATRMFVERNKLEGRKATDTDDWNWIEHTKPENKLAAALDAPAVNTEDAEVAYEHVLEHAGASRPARDAVDLRIVQEVREGGGHVVNNPTDVGGWPSLASSEPPVDGDGDGMPDAWESEHGFNPSDATDGPQDREGDGYTNLEEFLNLTAP